MPRGGPEWGRMGMTGEGGQPAYKVVHTGASGWDGSDQRTVPSGQVGGAPKGTPGSGPE